MKYTGIKKILKKHIDLGLNTLWNWDKDNQNFICLYQKFNNELPIYTSQQLLDILNEKEIVKEKDNC
jgi:hypothetical protein